MYCLYYQLVAKISHPTIRHFGIQKLPMNSYRAKLQGTILYLERTLSRLLAISSQKSLDTIRLSQGVGGKRHSGNYRCVLSHFEPSFCYHQVRGGTFFKNKHHPTSKPLKTRPQSILGGLSPPLYCQRDGAQKRQKRRRQEGGRRRKRRTSTSSCELFGHTYSRIACYSYYK